MVSFKYIEDRYTNVCDTSHQRDNLKRVEFRSVVHSIWITDYKRRFTDHNREVDERRNEQW